MKVQTAERLNHINEYYFSKKLSQIRSMPTNGREIINLGIGNPDMEPASEVIRSAVDSASLNSSHGYQPYRGIPELRESFSEWYRRIFHVTLSAEHEILPLMGSKEGVMHTSMAFLNRGDGVLVPNPGYPAYEAAAKMCGAKVNHYHLLQNNNWYPDFNAIEKINLDDVKIMWVNYPNMPTGKRATTSLFDSLIAFGHKHNILIINDNPYSLILNPNPLSILASEGAKEIALKMNSLSKSHNMAGWRIGMVAGSKSHIDAILKVKSNMDSGMFLPIQHAAVKALGLGGEWYEKLNAAYMTRRAIVHQILKKLGSAYETDQSGLFVWSTVPDKWRDAEQFSDHLLKKFGLFITPGSAFGSNGDRFIRTSLCVSEDRLKESLERIS
jgi:aspartate/methionine/tyrosine aminotransferase